MTLEPKEIIVSTQQPSILNRLLHNFICKEKRGVL